MATLAAYRAPARSSTGCWTCRVRHKRCDERPDTCIACEALGLHCLYSEEKPEWYDNGEKLKAKVDELKAEVKRNASSRRERKYLQSMVPNPDVDMVDTLPEPSVRVLQASTAPTMQMPLRTPASPPTTRDSVSQQDSPPSESSIVHTPASSLGNDSSSQSSTKNCSPEALNTILIESATAVSPQDFSEKEMHFIMLYLDYVFPFLFPYYKPDLLESGRGWLLVLLMRNKALFHTATALASQFFSLALETATLSDHQDCRATNSEVLQQQQNLALKELQVQMCKINLRGVKGLLKESSHIVASMMHLLHFEVATGNTQNWQWHLDAASSLFEEMVKHHGMPDGENMSWTHILQQLGNEKTPYTLMKYHHPWNTDQAALRFFTSSLLFMDVLSSTVLEKAPRLQRFHSSLLEPPVDRSDHDHPVHLSIDMFIGVENWVVIGIGKIAALDAWKKEMKKKNCLSIIELVTRAAAIERDLRARLDPAAPGVRPLAERAGAIVSSVLYEHTIMPHVTGSEYTAKVSRIWAQAALTYLSVVVSGWQPASDETRSSVSATLGMLCEMPNATCLRHLVWPFCITGCMAAPEQESIFRDLVTAMGPMKVFGTIQEAFVIMENVWKSRATIKENADSWDIAACFKTLGHLALLI